MKVMVFLTIATGICLLKHSVHSRPDRCPSNFYMCPPFTCISDKWLCDTIVDCKNAVVTDEDDCPTDCTGPNQFLCNNGRCISKTYRCNRRDECGDNTDEQDCDHFGIPTMLLLMERWAEHYHNLYSTENVVTESALANIPTLPVMIELDLPPTEDELHSLAQGKAPGNDGLPAKNNR